MKSKKYHRPLGIKLMVFTATDFILVIAYVIGFSLFIKSQGHHHFGTPGDIHKKAHFI